MRGGTNNGMKVQGNCLKPSKRIQGSKQTRPTQRLNTQTVDTKVTIISPEQLTSLKSETSSLPTKASPSFQEVLRGGAWGPTLSPPVWRTDSETFHAVNKVKTSVVEEDMQQTDSVSPTEVVEEVEVKVLYVADSIGSHCDFQSIEKATGADIVAKRAYSSVEDMRARWPESNFRDVVPVQLAEGKYNQLVMQAPSVDITNMKRVVNKTSKQYQRGDASTSSFNMIKTAEKALQQFPNLKGVLIAEHAPRHDNMREISQFSNQELHRHLKHSLYKDKIKIGLHTLDFEGEEKDSVYGSKQTNTKPDGYHLRGPNGKHSFTKSLLNIFNKAGLNKEKKTLVHKVVKEIPVSVRFDSKVNPVKQVGQFRPTVVEVRLPTKSAKPTPKVQNKPNIKQVKMKDDGIMLGNKFTPLVNHQPEENQQPVVEHKLQDTKSLYKKKLKTNTTPKKSQKQKNLYQKNNKMKKSPKKEVKDLKTTKEYRDVTKNNQLSIAEHCNQQYENEETSQNKYKDVQKPDENKSNKEPYKSLGSCVLLPQVEEVLANNPDLRGTFTRLADEMSASLEKTSLGLEETEKKLTQVYPEVKEWWENAGNSTCEANQALLEDTILDSNTYEMAGQDKEIAQLSPSPSPVPAQSQPSPSPVPAGG